MKFYISIFQLLLLVLISHLKGFGFLAWSTEFSSQCNKENPEVDERCGTKLEKLRISQLIVEDADLT